MTGGGRRRRRRPPPKCHRVRVSSCHVPPPASGCPAPSACPRLCLSPLCFKGFSDAACHAAVALAYWTWMPDFASGSSGAASHAAALHAPSCVDSSNLPDQLVPLQRHRAGASVVPSGMAPAAVGWAHQDPLALKKKGAACYAAPRANSPVPSRLGFKDQGSSCRG